VAVERSVLEGFDVSQWVVHVDWPAITAGSRFSFAFVECARGTDVGSDFRSVWCGRDSHLFCGPYHRLFSTATATDQIQAFLDAFAQDDVALEETDLPPVLDVEYDQDSHQLSDLLPGSYTTMMKDWINAIQLKFKRRPIIYTGPSFWREYLGSPSDFHDLPLWIADYNVAEPDVPEPWSAYTFWQHAKDQVIAGKLSADLDRFAGDADKLRGLIEASKL
jgi:lysozyme